MPCCDFRELLKPSVSRWRGEMRVASCPGPPAVVEIRKYIVETEVFDGTRSPPEDDFAIVRSHQLLKHLLLDVAAGRQRFETLIACLNGNIAQRPQHFGQIDLEMMGDQIAVAFLLAGVQLCRCEGVRHTGQDP